MDLDQREAEIDAFNVPSDAIRMFPSRRSRVTQSPSAPVLPTVKPKNKGQLLRLSASSQDLVASAYEKEVKSLRPRDRTPTGYQIIARRRQAERPLKLTKLPKVPEASSSPPAQPPSPSPTRRRSATKEDMSADVSAREGSRCRRGRPVGARGRRRRFCQRACRDDAY